MAIMQYMDEILIEEKKYISSKQAAKMTGYAKDYIGQLCREGRVPARLVGRSWYVLESAIQDHRFGNQEKEVESMHPVSAVSLTHTWESTRYESSYPETIPSLNRLQKTENATAGMDGGDDRGIIELSRLHDSWKAWFDRVGEAVPTVDTSIAVPEAEEVVAVEEKSNVVIEEIEEEVSIPLHVMVEKRPLREILPIERVELKRESVEFMTEDTSAQDTNRRNLLGVLRAAVAFVAVITAVLAAANSGYFDSFFISNSRAGFISGMSILNK